jgi:hemerythrin superfamily protein
MHIRIPGMPNAIDMLKADHVKVKELFHHYESAGDRAHQNEKSIAEEVFTELEAHTTLEEEIFYPAMKRKKRRCCRRLRKS